MEILQEISLNLNLVGVTQMNLINILKQSRELNEEPDTRSMRSHMLFQNWQIYE